MKISFKTKQVEISKYNERRIKMKVSKLINIRLNPRYNDITTLEYWLRYVDYLSTILYSVIVFGDKKKIKEYTQKNVIHKYRYNLLKVEQDKLSKYIDDMYRKEDCYDFKGIKMPLISGDRYRDGLIEVYKDVFKIFCEYDDNYDWKMLNKIESKLSEGTYCYNGKHGEKIIVEAGDVVIDAGAWIGDFSAYASCKGATVYAFEPTPDTLSVLKETAMLNKNINIIPMGLGEKEEVLLFKEVDNNSGGNRFDDSGDIEIKITSLDEWASDNKIEKIDFIKADIEGYERYMLIGAQESIKKHKPKLSICTYHLPDDPEVLEKIIQEIDPRYRVIQRKMKLFAYVDENK